MPAGSLDDFSLVRPLAKHEQISAYLRDQILSGALAPEARLPTTSALAARWQVPITVIQAAFAPLVKEGLLRRRPGVGTVVRSRQPGLTRVGIYLPVCAELPERFASRLAVSLDARLHAGGVASLLFADHRPGEERGTAPPELLLAARNHQIDAVIAAETDERITTWLKQLPVPTAMNGSGPGPNEAHPDIGSFAAQGVACLAERGCRRVGLITVLVDGLTYADGSLHPYGGMQAAFRAAQAGHGLGTQEAWIRGPRGVVIEEREAERFGFEQVRDLWSAAERPDGLLVYTDRAARGVVMGLLALGVQAALPRLALHRHAELGLFCPLPADVLESRVEDRADALIALIEEQRQGRSMTRRQTPFRLVRG